MYKWHRVRVMREKGAGIKRIARDLGISKNTVRKYLRSADPPTFQARAYCKKMDSYREDVVEMVGKRYIGTRIYEELKAKGFEGSLASVHRFIRGYREGEEIRAASTTRFETPPGEQMQYDWKEWVLPVGGRKIKVYLHEVVLGYSRMKHYSFSLRIEGQDVMRAIEAAILSFGGTAREIVIDNPKQMVITHRRDGIVYYNEDFLKFCGLYGIEPRACRNYRARTKGKVERPFFYLQEHLLRGLSVLSLEEFEEKLISWTLDYNQRPHSTLGEPPAERFVREIQALKPVRAVEPTLLYDREVRRVSNDGYLRYRGGFYPVPMRFCLQELWLECVLGRRLRIYEKNGGLLSEQEVQLDPEGPPPVHPEHEAINRKFGEKREGVRSAVVQKFLSRFGTTGQRYISGLREAVSAANIYWHLSEILACSEVYRPEEVGRSLEACIQIGAYHKNSVLRLLDPDKLSPPPPNIPRVYPQGHQAEIGRPLSVYAGLGEEVGHG